MMLPELYPFQKQGVRKIWDFKGRVIVGDQVGLGKTPQALTYFLQNSTARPGVVICPAGLKLQWQREAYKFCKIESLILRSRQAFSLENEKAELFILNDEILAAWLPYLKKIKPQIVVYDEAHRLANISSQRTKNIIRLVHWIKDNGAIVPRVPHVLLLTGTPIVNRHWDLYPLLFLLDPKRWDSPYSFGMEFCNCEQAAGEMVFKDSINRKKLSRILHNSYLIRRTKDEVLPDLPKLSRHMLPLECADMREYQHAESDLISWLSTYDVAAADRAKRALRFVKYGYLKRLACKIKMPLVLDWIDNWLQESEGKLILGAIHRQNWPHTIAEIDNRYKGYAVSLHGGKTQKEKDDAVTSFNNSKGCRIIVLQYKSGGMGLNLQGKDRTMAGIELPWTPGDIEQFIGRAHRIGCLDPVQVWFPVAANTIEEKLCGLLQKKAKVQNDTIDQGRGKQLNIFDELQHALQRRCKTPGRS